MKAISAMEKKLNEKQELLNERLKNNDLDEQHNVEDEEIEIDD